MGYVDGEGIYIYDETDAVTPFSEFENKGQRSVSAALTAVGERIASLADTSWTPYVPTLLNMNKGTTGQIKGFWRGDENEVTVQFSVVFGGSNWSMGTDPGFTLPVPAVVPLHAFAAYAGTGGTFIGGSVAPLFVLARNTSQTQVTLFALAPNTSGYININPTTPQTWGAGSAMSIQFSYRPA